MTAFATLGLIVSGAFGAPAPPGPTLGSASPNTVEQGMTTTVTISGNGFISGTSLAISIKGTGDSGVSTGSTTWVSATTLTVPVTTTATATVASNYTILLTNGDSSTASKPNAFSVVAPPSTPTGSPTAHAAVIGVQSLLGTQPSSASPLGWSTESSTVSTSLSIKSIDAMDNTHIWAVGDNCTFDFSSDGVTWTKDTQVPLKCNSYLTGVFLQGGAGPGWAVGSGGTVLVCSTACNTATAVWSYLMPGSVVGAKDGTLTNGSLAAVSNSLFATTAYVGYSISDASGKIPLNTTISSVNPATKTATLSSKATASVANDTFTVTAPSSVLPPSSINFTSVWAADANHVYAVGSTVGGPGVIWACSNNCNQTTTIPPSSATPPPPAPNTAAWANVMVSGLASTALNGVSGSGANFVVAVGSGGTVLVCATNACATSGSGWTGLTPGTGGTTPATSILFNSVSVSDPNDVYAVGKFSSGAGVIWACSNDCNTATTGPAQVPSPPAPAPPPPTPPGNNAAWANVTPASPSPVPGTLESVTTQGPNAAWAVSTTGAIWYCPQNCTTEPTGWTSILPSYPSSAPVLYGVDASDPNHVWAVGAAGTIVAQVNPSSAVNTLGQSVGDLGVGLNLTLWSQTNPDGNHVDPNLGAQVFQNTQQAVQALSGINNPPPPPPGNPAYVVTDMSQLDYAMWLIASNAIADNCSAKNNNLTTAQTQLTNGDSQFDNGQYPQAIGSYLNAWKDAIASNGTPCTNPVSLSQTAQTTCTVTPMSPGDGTISPGAPANDSEKQCSLSVTYTGTIAAYLGLDVAIASTHAGSPVAEYGTGTPLYPSGAPGLYDGTATGLQVLIKDQQSTPTTYMSGTTLGGTATLKSGSASANDLLVSTSSFTNGATFVFTIDYFLPKTADNSYQGAGSSITLTVAAVQTNGSTSGCTAGQPCPGITWS